MKSKPIRVGMMLDETTIPGLSTAEIAAYASVSGDTNPVHTDLQIARKIGLENVPVQGMFVMALVNNYLKNWQHYKMMRKLHIRFVAPALANSTIRIAAKVMVVSEQNQTTILRVLLHQADKLVALGEADIVFNRT
jgi:acyl dehydratase